MARIAKEAVPLVEIEMLKQNYQTLITVLNEDNDPGINNFSLHFILTISSGYLK